MIRLSTGQWDEEKARGEGEGQGRQGGKEKGGVGKGRRDREERREREVGKNRGRAGGTELHFPQSYPPPITPPRRRLGSKLALKSVGI